MRTVCAYCTLVMLEGPEPTSHGMCPTCFDREMAELDKTVSECVEPGHEFPSPISPLTQIAKENR